MAKLIVLDGWPAAGKSTLWALLAGHKNIFVEPLHTYFYEAAFLLGLDDIPKIYTLREIRQCLSRTEYYKTEQYALSGEVPIHFGEGKTERLRFDFDWYSFDRSFMSQIVGVELTFNDFIDKYLYCYQEGLGRSKKDYEYFLTMSNYYNSKVTRIKAERLNFKVIVAFRSYQDIIWSRIRRLPRKEDGANKKDFAPNFKRLLLSGEVESISGFYRDYAAFEGAIIVDVPQLISSKKRSLKIITEWLGIEDIQGPLIDVFLENQISNKYSFSNGINDEANFDLYQKVLLTFHRLLNILFPIDAFILNPKSLMILIYKNWTQSKSYGK